MMILLRIWILGLILRFKSERDGFGCFDDLILLSCPPSSFLGRMKFEYLNPLLSSMALRGVLGVFFFFVILEWEIIAVAGRRFCYVY
jgi:hypothetical protein